MKKSKRCNFFYIIIKSSFSKYTKFLFTSEYYKNILLEKVLILFSSCSDAYFALKLQILANMFSNSRHISDFVIWNFNAILKYCNSSNRCITCVWMFWNNPARKNPEVIILFQHQLLFRTDLVPYVMTNYR